jgi:CRP-like cAMP-binding protein
VLNLTQHIKDLSFLDALERVSNYLYGLSLEYGVNTEFGIMLNIIFTHQEMADLIGTCRVTVSKIMNYLKQNRIIDKVDGYIYIKDIEKLKRLCRF